MSKVEQIVEALKDLTLVEASELVSKIEKTFGVSAAAPAAVAVAAPAAGTAAPAVEEKTEFNVVVKDVPDNKIPVIKVVKNILNIGLADAKSKVESAPFILLEGVKKEEAEKVKAQLVEAGATVSLE